MLRGFILLLFLTTAARAQEPLLRHYTLRDGLPGNTIYSLYQDRKGFVWFCTNQGLSRFDGHHFQNYSINEGLPDNEVLNIAEDSFGRYWVACYNREPCYLKADRVYTARNDALCRQAEALGLEYTALFTDRDGVTCLAGRRVAGIYADSLERRYPELSDGLTIGQYHRAGDRDYVALGLSNLFIRRGRRSRLLQLGVSEYVSFFQGDHFFAIGDDARGNALYQYRLSGDSVIPEHVAPFPAYGYGIWTESDTSLLCLTARGVYTYSIRSHHLQPAAGLPRGQPFNRVLQARDGRLWLGTLNDGVYLRGPGPLAAAYQAASGVSDRSIVSVNSQPDGSLTAGFSGGFYEIDSARVRTVPLSVLGQLNRVLFAYRLADGDFLAGTDRGLYRGGAWGRIRLAAGAAQKACFREGDRFYIANSSGAFRYDSRTGATIMLRAERTTAIAADTAGTVWLGSLRGLYCWNAGVVRRFDRDSGLSSSRITSMDRLADGRLAIATHRDGLYLWDGRRLRNIRQAQGLSSDHCIKVTADSGARLWLCTDRGLDRVDAPPAGLPSVYRYRGPDGFVTEQVVDVAADRTHLYAATTDGLVMLPKNAAWPAAPAPDVYIVSATTHDTTLPFPEGTLRLQYPQNTLQIAYTGISFESSPPEYRYVLEGGSPDTVQTPLDALDLSAVRPGHYRLLLWARTDGSPWSPAPATLDIVVQPPFWLTGGFIMLVAAIVVVLAYGLYQRKIRQVRRSAREKGAQRQRMAELELQALRAQINPHFLFNALNSIQNFYSQNDERKANRYLSLFAQLIRRTLHHSKTQLLPLAEEIDLLTTYTELEHMRFKQAFSYTIEIARDVAPNQLLVPAMLLQPYVENAIQHGLRPLSGRPGKLLLSFDRAGDFLVCRIDDNGIGFAAAQQHRRGEHQSLGMDINRQRIANFNRMHKLRISVSVVDKTASGDHGTCIVLTLPILPA